MGTVVTMGTVGVVMGVGVVLDGRITRGGLEIGVIVIDIVVLMNHCLRCHRHTTGISVGAGIESHKRAQRIRAT